MPNGYDEYAFQIVSVPGATGEYLGGINDFGEISGSYMDASSGDYSDIFPQPFTLSDGDFNRYQLGAYISGQFIYGAGINNFGVAVSYEHNRYHTDYGQVYANGKVSQVSVAPYQHMISEALGVNDWGQIVGTMKTEAYLGVNENGSIGYLSYGGQTTGIAEPDGLSTTATGINDWQTIVGNYTTTLGSNPVTHGYVRVWGWFIPINVPGATSTYVEGINNHNDAVGYYFDGSHYHGFVENLNSGKMTFINAPGATDTLATGINDFGQIVGEYFTSTPSLSSDEFGYAVIGNLYPTAGNSNVDHPIGFVATPDLHGQAPIPDYIAWVTGRSSGQPYFDSSDPRPVVAAMLHT